MNVRFSTQLVSERPRSFSAPQSRDRSIASAGGVSDRLVDMHTDHRTVDALDAFSDYLLRDEQPLEIAEPQAPEEDPRWQRIAALERAGRTREAAALQRQWLQEEALYGDEADIEDYLPTM